MAITDRLGFTVDATEAPSSSTPNAGLAIKTAVRVATTGANIVLSGLQTIDGVALAAGDRVLVKDQTDQTTNGIYNVSTGNWAASSDFQSNTGLAQGLLVFVTSGSLHANSLWALTAANPIVLGTSALTFSQIAGVTATLTLGTTTLTLGGTTTNVVGLTLTDNSSTLSSGAAFWSPFWAGIPGTGITDRFNRVFVGSATAGLERLPVQHQAPCRRCRDGSTPCSIRQSRAPRSLPPRRHSASRRSWATRGPRIFTITAAFPRRDRRAACSSPTTTIWLEQTPSPMPSSASPSSAAEAPGSRRW